MVLQLAVATVLSLSMGAPSPAHASSAIQAPRDGAQDETGSSAGAQDPRSSRGDLLAVIAGQGLGRSAAALEAAGLSDLLRGEGPLTVFAPNDAAFDQLPAGLLAQLQHPSNQAALARLLRHHVFAGSLPAKDAILRGRIESSAGSRWTVDASDGGVTIGDSRVLTADARATNGVVHAIDRVLMPPEPFSLLPTNATQLIELAIERGVPQFNDGNLEACAAIYETAVVGLLQRESLPAEARAALAAGYRQAASEEPRIAAWTLRRALDRAYASVATPDPAPRADAVAPAIFDFDSVSQARQWGSLDDTVMGGRSDSRMEAGGDGWARFTGELSLENNGGFASVRAAVERESLEGTTGVELRVRGDGRTYRFLVSTSRRGGIGSYDIEFPTTAGQWQVVRLPFEDMKLNIMGRRPVAPPPSADSIASIGLLLGDKKPGPFALDVDWIRAYR